MRAHFITSQAAGMIIIRIGDPELIIDLTLEHTDQYVAVSVTHANPNPVF